MIVTHGSLIGHPLAARGPLIGINSGSRVARPWVTPGSTAGHLRCVRGFFHGSLTGQPQVTDGSPTKVALSYQYVMPNIISGRSFHALDIILRILVPGTVYQRRPSFIDQRVFTSISTGGTFSPPAVMMSSLIRPVMRMNPLEIQTNETFQVQGRSDVYIILPVIQGRHIRDI